MNNLPVYIAYRGNGTQTDYTFNFSRIVGGYDQVLVFINEVRSTAAGYTVTNVNANTIRITPAPNNGARVTILRDTETDKLRYTFYLGSSVTPQRLDYNFTQLARSIADTRGGLSDLRLYTTGALSTLETNVNNQLSAINTSLGTIYQTLQTHDNRITAAQNAASMAQYTADTSINTANDALLITNTTVIKDVTLSDGSIAKSLGKVVSEQILSAGVGEVRTVAGYTGDVTATDLAEHPTIKASTKEARYVITGSGRTQEVKNTDNLTPLDVNAVGDGVTDDSAAFNVIESTYTGRVVDLLGRTYKVSKTPFKNEYINGSFTTSTNINQRTINDLSSSYKHEPIINNQNVDYYIERYNLVRGESTGGINSVPQGASYDDHEGVLYQVSAGGTDGRGHSLNIFKDVDLGVNTNYHYVRSTYFGHQGVGLMRDGGRTIVWCSSNYNSTLGTGKYVTSFDNTVDVNSNSVVEGMTLYQVYENSTSAQSTTPTISTDGNLLVTRFIANALGDVSRIRVFDAKRMYRDRLTKTDYSNDYLVEFNLKLRANTSFQSTACDGVYIYFLQAEYGFNANAWVDIYTINGKYLNSVNIAHIGHTDAVNDCPNPSALDGVKEYEGLLIFKDADKVSLGIVLATTYQGDINKKTCRIYQVGSRTPLINTPKGLRSFSKGVLTNASGYTFGVTSTGGDFSWTVNPTRKGVLTNGNNPIFDVNQLYSGMQLLSTGTEGMSNLLLARTDAGNEGARLLFHKSKSTSADPLVYGDMTTARMGTIYFSGDTANGRTQGATIVAGGTTNGANIDAYVDVTVGDGVGGNLTQRIDKDAIFPTTNNTRDVGKASLRYRKGWFASLNIGAPPVYADNAAAKAGGLANGDTYRTSTGQLMVVF
jgi:hypothetical protein